MKRIITECTCTDPSHIMAFWYDVSDDPHFNEFYMEVQLNPRLAWWKRIVVATTYILGKRSKFSSGHWDEGSIGLEGAKALQVGLAEYIAAGEKT